MDMTPAEWNRVKELFQTALDLDPSQRVAFLAENCHDDQIRTEVERLLRNYQEAASFFNDPALNPLWEDRTTEGSSDSRAASTLFTTPFETEEEKPMTGRRLGAYKVVRCIGQGGMAAVFLATRADDEYQKQVAIKLVHQGLDSRELLSRFRNERQTLADLDHPNIVKLLDGGSTPEGAPFLVMDYVEGTAIDEYCDHHKLCVGDRLRLFSKVCEALQYAHRKSIVHRDLKPSNILVTNDGTPKVLDFGIAKVLSPQTSAQTLTLTQTRTRCMTPAYASPEQMRGKPVTTATDIYSLGVVLYELLSGHRPYRLKEHTALELERAICEQEPEPPSTAVSRVETEITSSGIAVTKTPELVSQTREGSPEKLRRHLRGDLDNIVLKALQKEPERRYGSVKEFEADIDRHLKHLPVTARPSSLGCRASKFGQRHKTEVSLCVLGLLVVAGAAVIFTLDAFRLRERRAGGTPIPRIQSLAVLPFDNLFGDPAQEYFSDGTTDALIGDLSQIDSLRVISRTSTMRYKKSGKSPTAIARELGVDGIVEGTVQRSGDRVRITVLLIQEPSDKRLWANTYERDLHDMFALEREVTSDIAVQVRGRIESGNQTVATQPRPVNLTALDAYLQGNYHLNKADMAPRDEEMRKAGKFFQRAIDADPDFVPAYIGLSEAHHNLWWPSSEDFEIFQGSAARALRLAPDSSEAHRAVAFTKYEDWDWAGAEEEYRRSIALNPNNSAAHDLFGAMLDEMGRMDEGWKEYQLAQSLDPNQDHLSGALHRRGQYDREFELLRRAIESRPDDYALLWQMSENYAQRGLYREWAQEWTESARVSGLPEIAARVERAFATSGYSGALQQEARDGERLAAKGQGYFPGMLAEIYAALGDKDRAFYWLQQGCEHRHMTITDPIFAFVKVYPGFASLRSDPRFQGVLRCMGLPP